MQTKREGFSNRFGVLVAVAGSAVGLGNLWRFPYMVGTNGGAAFIILYLIFVILLCLPIMISEFVIGRRGQSNAVGSVRNLLNGKKSGWQSIGIISVIASLCILAFYSVVGGWTIDYIFRSFSSSFLSADSGEMMAQFSAFSSTTWLPLIMTLLFLVISAVIVAAGVKNGIEKYSKVLMPLLFVLVILLAIRSLTLPGAAEGVRFLLKPDFSKITGQSMLAALGQAFFSLSLGMGCMITYGSYINKKENLFKISLMSAGADTGFALLAGFAVMPAVFAFGISPGQGPSLVFITLPQVFAQLPFGQIISAAFFFLLLIAALTSSISLFEVVVAYLSEEKKMKRITAVIITFLIVALFGTLSSLSQGVLSEVKLFGKNIFEIFDYASSNILLPLGGLLIVLFVGWKMSRKDVLDELSNEGTISIKSQIFSFLIFTIKFLAPIAIILVLLSSLGLIKF